MPQVGHPTKVIGRKCSLVRVTVNDFIGIPQLGQAVPPSPISIGIVLMAPYHPTVMM